MVDVANLSYPVLAFTLHGVLPFSCCDDLLRVGRREYNLGWYRELEIVDSSGVCVVVRSASIIEESFFARILGGGLVQARIDHVGMLGVYSVDALRDRVLEFLSVYPSMYDSAGTYDEVVRKITNTTSIQGIIGIVAAFT